jgi:hypothetical protein
VPDLSVSGNKFDLMEVDPHDPTTTSEPEAPMQSLNQLPVVTDLVISLITKINSCLQSKNEQEQEASNLYITRRWSSAIHEDSADLHVIKSS